MTSGEHLRVKYRIEHGAAMNPGAVVLSELGGFGGQEVFEVPPVERRPSKQYRQDQHSSEIRFRDRAWRVKTRRCDERRADLAKGTPKKQQGEKDPEHETSVVRRRVARAPAQNPRRLASTVLVQGTPLIAHASNL